ncbi:hypothetical protein J2X69_004818, partial [Algoriphagus sp. 4150]|uniref:hypothetical protein n=1 Tax=Algoriphagus sp. 4150 TaxID=2817756 RepID=UPI00285E4795
MGSEVRKRQGFKVGKSFLHIYYILNLGYRFLILTRPELSLHKVNYYETTKRKKNKGHRISELG